MEPITVREIAEAVGGKLLGAFDDLDRTVTHVFTDSREPDPGALFIPLVGERFDGHAFIHDALTGGAAGCFTQRERETYLPGKFYIKVSSTQKALRDLARHYKQKFKIPFVGVTGSVGKTTTKDMVAAVLGEKFKVLKTEGNFNNEVGLPLTLLRLNRQHELCVLEMGMNHFGEIEYLSGIVEQDTEDQNRETNDQQPQAVSISPGSISDFCFQLVMLFNSFILQTLLVSSFILWGTPIEIFAYHHDSGEDTCARKAP